MGFKNKSLFEQESDDLEISRTGENSF